MKLSEITLKNFRGIHELDIQLNEKSTVFFGINGVGKSSVLRAVDLLYANIIGRLAGSSKKLAQMTEDDIMNGKAAAYVSAGFRFRSGEVFSYWRKISRKSGRKHCAQLRDLIRYFEEQYITKPYEDADENLIFPPDQKNMPVFVNYGVNRLVADIPLEAAKQKAFEKLNATPDGNIRPAGENTLREVSKKMIYEFGLDSFHLVRNRRLAIEASEAFEEIEYTDEELSDLIGWYDSMVDNGKYIEYCNAIIDVLRDYL